MTFCKVEDKNVDDIPDMIKQRKKERKRNIPWKNYITWSLQVIRGGLITISSESLKYNISM